jgi:D-inositol-3-phosphate glycosyltransferase
MPESVKPVVLGQQFIPLRRPYQSNVNELHGATIAHQELLNATLKYTNIEAVHLFYPPSFSTLDSNEELAKLRAEFGPERIVAYHYPLVPDLVHRHDYVMLCGGLLSTEFHQLRRATSATFPICCIQHCCHLSSRTTFAESIHAVLSGRPGDVVVATSRAGKRFLSDLSEQVKERMRDTLGFELGRGSEIVHIPLGTDTESFANTDRSASRRLLDISADAIAVLSVCRFDDAFKADLEPLLVTLRRLVRNHSEIVLILAGREGIEAYSEYLKKVASAIGVSTHIRVIPNFPHFVKSALYAAADIFVSVAENVQETFGVALIEAMAAGLPIVASDWSGFRDIVSHDETGFLIPTKWPAEAAESISRSGMLYSDTFAEKFVSQRTIVDLRGLYESLRILVQDAGTRKRMGEAGRLRARNSFSLVSIARRYEELWRAQRRSASKDVEAAAAVPKALNFNLFYSHFATERFESDRHLVPADDCQDLVQCLLRRGQRRPFGISLDTTLEVIRLCTDAARTTDQLQAAIGLEARDASCWLIKKGYLREL